MIEISGSKGEVHELKCPACGFQNLIGEKYCSECGEALNQETKRPSNKPPPEPETQEHPPKASAHTIRCRRCGHEVQTGKNFCSECGAPMKSSHTNPNQNVATQSAVKVKKKFQDDNGTPSLLAPNSVLQGRYQITKLIGQGGMGAIYLADDLRFSNRVAVIKEMLDHFSDPEQRRIATSNFDREAEMLANLNHVGIPQVYDRFNEGNRHYLVMEYIEGADLEHKLMQQDRPFSPNNVVDWAIQICDILSYLHSQNPPIIYRDMKPANLILTPQGRIYVVDFGIARHFTPNKKGTMIGTQGYAPPEQYRGQVEPRSDLYALGATMHHMLTARDPQNEAPFTFPPLRQVNPKVAPDLEKIVMRALEMEPENRFKDTKDMLDAMMRISLKSNRQSLKLCPRCHSRVSLTQSFCPNCNQYLSSYRSNRINETVPISNTKGISTILMRLGVSQKLFSPEWLLRLNIFLLIAIVILLVILITKQ